MSRFFTIVSGLMIAKVCACTDFLLMDQNQACVVGRSMEFGTDLQSNIVIIPQLTDGQYYQSMMAGQPGLTWEQTYGVLGISAFGNDQLIMDGMNDQGLSVEVLWFPDAQYPEASLSNLEQTIALEDVATWLLMVAATVDDVKTMLNTVSIYPNKIAAFGNSVPPIHFSIHDRMGNTLAVEFLNGQMCVSDNPVGVLTNNPSLDWQNNNLRNYMNLSATNAPDKTVDDLPLTPMGQGSGMIGLPGDYTPPSRFVKIALLKESVTTAADVPSNVNLAWHLLNSVDIPKGAIQAPNGTCSDYTQWTIVKDLQNTTLYYRTYDNLNIQSIALVEVLTQGNQKLLMAPNDNQ